MTIDRQLDTKKSSKTRTNPVKQKIKPRLQMQDIIAAAENQIQGNLTIKDDAFGNNNITPLQSALTFREPALPHESILESLGKKCFEWAKNEPTALKIRSFFRELGYDFDDVERFKNKSVVFKRYYYMALEEIGDRREIAALNRKMSEGMVMNSMVNYDPDWRRMRQEKVEIAARIAQTSQGNITVLMNPVPQFEQIAPAAQFELERPKDETT